MEIHKTAIVHPNAILGKDVEIGPYKMQCACEGLMSINGGKDMNLCEGEFVGVKTKSLGISPVYEVWERYCCKSCGRFHYKIRLTETSEDTTLPLEFICPEQRLTRLENSSIR